MTDYTQIILSIIGVFTILAGSVRIVIDWYGRFQLEKESRKTRLMESEINRSVNFEQQIINTIFEKYVGQTDWITKLFESKFEELVKQMAEQHKLSKDTYAQLEQMKREIRELQEIIKHNSKDIAKIEGLLSQKGLSKTMFDKPNDSDKLKQNWDNIER